MKNIFLILLLFMISCAQIKPVIIYDKTYTDRDKVIYDIYETFEFLKIDSIPINDWIPTYYEENGYSIIRYVPNEDSKTICYLIFSTHYSDSTYYNFKVECYKK
jgi:hypothetical protein